MCERIINLKATKHMTPHWKVYYTNKVIAPEDMHLVDVVVKNKMMKLRMKNVIHVPKLQANKLLVEKLLSRRLKMQFTLEGFTSKKFRNNV